MTPTSSDPGPVELIGEAHAAVMAIRESLTNPTAATLLQSLPLFERAADSLRRLHRILREDAAPSSPELASSALGLREEIARVNVLLEASAAFRLGWMQRLGARLGGYTPQGAASPLAGGRRVLAEG